MKKDSRPVELDVYAFMATTPNGLTDGINHERMPVLLTSETDFETWLSGSTNDAFALARSFDPNAMLIVQSSKDKEDLLGMLPPTTMLQHRSRIRIVIQAIGVAPLAQQDAHARDQGQTDRRNIAFR